MEVVVAEIVNLFNCKSYGSCSCWNCKYIENII